MKMTILERVYLSSFFSNWIGEKAIEHLKEIGAMMSDFQDIINQCREEEKKKKGR
jgi:hypothetical protein